MDLILDCKAFVNGSLKETSIGIEDGKIVTVGNIIRGENRIELKDRLVLPGFIDPHVHFRDPGLTNKEDFRSGSLSALHGGVTCVLDMPNTYPPVTNSRILREKKAAIRSKAYVDYGLFSAVTADSNITELAKGSAGFKLFMGSTTGNVLMNNDAVIERTISKIASTGKMISVHAEDNDMISREHERSNHDHLKNRPVEAELNAISRLTRYKGSKINICHVTSSASLDIARNAGFTTETTLHHLLFNSSAEGTEFKVNPPLRDEDTRERLFQSLINGKIHMFGSDHAPHTEKEKSDDYGSAPSGISGVEVTMPVVMNLFKKGIIPLDLIVRMASLHPASVFGMNKGSITKGTDADLVVFDLRSVNKIRPEKLHGKNPTSVYQGVEAIFPDMVMLRGEIQIEKGEFCGGAIGEDIVD